MILHVTRHGQVDQATDHPVGDPYLSTVGREQARLLGEKLKELGFNGCIYGSPYLRTIETAQIVADVVDAFVIPAPSMREYVIREGQMDGFCGSTISDLKERYPRVDGENPLAEPWWTSEIETPEDIQARVKPLVDSAAEGDMDALLVGHGASITGVHAYILGRYAPDLLNHGRQGWNCVLSSFLFAETFNVVRLYDTDHLPEDLITANAKTRDEFLSEIRNSK